MSDTIADIEALTALTREQLKELWRRRLKSEPPTIRSTDFLRRLLAWKIQEKISGGLSPLVKRRLRRLATANENGQKMRSRPILNLKPGLVLTRAWDGRRHDVLVTDKGFEYAGRHYDNLSQIARAITRTRWSGPRFFGLKGGQK